MIGALRGDVAALGRRFEAVVVAEFLPVLEGNQAVEPVAVVEDVIPSPHGLVVAVAAQRVGPEIVVLQLSEVVVGGGEQRQNVLPDRADPAGGNAVVRERIANVLHSAGTLVGGGAEAGGEGIEDADSEVGEVLAVADEGGRNAGDQREGHDLAPAFLAEEEEVLVLADGAAGYPAELMLVVEAARLGAGVVLERVGVQDAVAPVVEDVAMPFFATGFERGVDGASAGTSELGVVGVGLHLEFLDSFDVGGDLPTAEGADRSAVQEELVGAGASAVDHVTAVGIPAARAGKAVGAELFLRKDYARGKRHQHVDLASVERVFLGLNGIEDGPAIGVGGLNNLLLAGDGDLLRHLSHLHGDREILLVGHAQDDVFPQEGLEAGRRGFDLIRAGLQIRNGIDARGAAFGFVRFVGAGIGGFHRGVGNRCSGRIQDLTGYGCSKVLSGR